QICRVNGIQLLGFYSNQKQIHVGSILESTDKQFVSASEKSTWNGKQDTLLRPVSSHWWEDRTPRIANDGVMEVGKYLDFHSTNGGTTDYDQRLEADATGLKVGGQYLVKNNDSRLTDARTPTSHTHDDRYYTETESDARFRRYRHARILTSTTTMY